MIPPLPKNLHTHHTHIQKKEKKSGAEKEVTKCWQASGNPWNAYSSEWTNLKKYILKQWLVHMFVTTSECEKPGGETPHIYQSLICF